ncbi:hypothetical protein ACFL29_02175 [Patescibacteria group bacterium]
MREKYKELIIELRPKFICDCCKVHIEDFLAFIFEDKPLHAYIIDKLDFLTEVVGHLQGSYRRGDGSVEKWFHRKRTKLGNFSVYRRLGWGWVPANVTEILELAKGANTDAT